MQLCFDATRFGTGLDEAIKLASSKGIKAVEYSFSPFSTTSEKEEGLDDGENEFLRSIAQLSKRSDVQIACLNFDHCLLPADEKMVESFLPMVSKLATVAQAVGCPKISISLMPGANGNWLKAAEKQVNLLMQATSSKKVGLLLRLATAAQFRGRSLKSWVAMEPQDWRDLISGCPSLGLSFSPADCIWLGIDYLKILSGVASAVEHVEVHDIEINRTLLTDSGMYGPLWWRYRLAGKGQMDWTQFIEALKLYDYQGSISIHLDDEFVADDFQSLEEALDSSIKLLAPLVRD